MHNRHATLSPTNELERNPFCRLNLPVGQEKTLGQAPNSPHYVTSLGLCKK